MDSTITVMFNIVVLKLVAVVTIMKRQGGKRKQRHLSLNESFCQQTVGVSRGGGNIRRELWLHFPPLSSIVPSSNTELRQQPVYLVAALCLSSA